MTQDQKFNKLRAEAEKRLLSLTELSEMPTAEEIKKLIHELQVHQIELEMQNQELREAQLLLEESRDQYADLFDFAPIGYFIIDQKGIILQSNLTAASMLGIGRGKLIGKPFALFIENEYGQLLLFGKFLKKIFESEKSESCELTLKNRKGTNFTTQISTLKMKDENGDFTQIRMSITDVTKERKAENIQSLLRAVLHGQESERERIAAELHDSINPLLSIASMNVSSLLDYFKESKAAPLEKLNSILLMLENAMRGVREISSNLSPALLKSFGLSKALEQLCKKVRETGKLKITYLAHGMEDRLSFDIELALYRIAQELLNNVLKHAQAKAVDIQLIKHSKSVVLMVQDNGKGFDASPEDIKMNGFGFKNITSRVQSLDGSLTIDSSLGKGTTVTIELQI